MEKDHFGIPPGDSPSGLAQSFAWPNPELSDYV
jgi:hypothetical protein